MAAFFRLRFAAPVLGLALLTAAAAGAAPFGYTVSDGELRRVDLFSGAYETIGPTGIGNGIASLAAVEAETFYGLGSPPTPFSGLPSHFALYRIDRATGHGEQVGSTAAIPLNSKLASAGDGLLYAADFSGNLYQVDTATAALTPIAATGAQIVGLAVWQGGLYLLDFQSGEGNCQLRRFDLGDHTLASIGPLACASSDPAVGEDGNLYQVNFYGPVGIPEPTPDWWIEVYRYDFQTQTQSWVSNWTNGEGRTQVIGLAAIGGGPILDVPVGGPALLVLAAGLALAALRTLRAW